MERLSGQSLDLGGAGIMVLTPSCHWEIQKPQKGGRKCPAGILSLRISNALILQLSNQPALVF